jgi:TRAP transporter TAXI family solute receptor
MLAGGLAAALYAVTMQSGTKTDGRIVMAAGSGYYQQIAETYRDDLEQFGVKLEVKDSLDGFAALRALTDNTSGVTAAFIKGGLVGSLQGRLASEKAKGRHVEYAKLQSLGRLFYEPVWVFTRGDMPIESLRDLKGKRVLSGTRESGTRRIANQLMRANGIGRDDATIIAEELDSEATQLKDGSADAAILVLPADSDKIQALLRVPNIRLMDFSPEAEAYTNRFPALAKVVLRQGSVEFQPLIPSEDITLLSTSVALVVRPDMDSALASLLTQAVISNPKSGFDKAGDPVLFYKAGEFPSPSDPEFQVPSESRQIYKTGELPFVLRVLGPVNHRANVPFYYTAYANAHAAKLVLLIPLLAIILPLFRVLPALYVWGVRRRLVYWYQQLKALERRLDSGGAKYDLGAQEAELDRIDTGVRRIRVPPYFSNQLYDLRGHIELVRMRLAAAPRATRMAAE